MNLTPKYLPIKTKNIQVQETPAQSSPPQDSLIARGLQREQYVGISILLLGLIAVVGFLNRRFEYALIFALTLSVILIVFFLNV